MTQARHDDPEGEAMPSSTADSSSEAPLMPDEAPSGPMGSTNDLATDSPTSALDRILQWVPRLLSSKPHVVLLMCLGVYLIILPLAGVKVSSQSELIGGNYTNVTSDIGACIAAGGTLHLIAQNRRRRKVEEERLRLARDTHRLLHYVYRDAATELGHAAVRAGQADFGGPHPQGGSGHGPGPQGGPGGGPGPEGNPGTPPGSPRQ